jgi:uncharacterized membrane protein YhaH (DUF805 family)
VNDPYNPSGGGGYQQGGGYQGAGGGYEQGGGYQGAGGYQQGGGYQGPGYPGGGYQGPGYPGGGFDQQQGQQGYLQGGPVDFQGAIRNQIANVLNFQGRASRSAYWWYALALLIVDVVLQIISGVAGSSALSLLVSLILIVVGLSGLSVGVRRLHDTDKSGWWILIGIIPIIGTIVLIVFLCTRGTPGPNRFG